MEKLLKEHELELYLFNKGENFQSYNVFGSHKQTRGGIKGVEFLVWAPKADSISVVGNFNNWDTSIDKMTKIEETGIWHLFIGGVQENEIYKYAVEKNSKMVLKADPYAVYSEVKPNTASVVYDLNGYKWHDQKWVKNKKNHDTFKKPLNIYEVHFGSWKLENSEYKTYEQLTEELIPYIISKGYTHIEIMPLMEHPYDGSWGYQSTGYFSITSRYGTPKEFMKFVDTCHQKGIGVILDWVPCHFCNDEHGLREFDGTKTFEHEDPKFHDNELWGTTNFDYAKTQIQSFLISNIMFFLEKYHIDGIRVDAVAFMLYQGYTTHESEVNAHAVSFLQKLNKEVFGKYPEVLMIAEESSAWPMVTAPIHDGGLGFNYKWNMGWMNDMLKYMSASYEERQKQHGAITFSIMYAFTENFILPMSHDEVVHGKKSLLNKMPGDYWQKFANLRMFYGYMYAYPGKKLLFMGGEFGQYIEWDYKRELDWFLEEYESHTTLEKCVTDLNHLYIKEESFYINDNQYKGFEWIDYSNDKQSIISFVRNGNDGELILVICNFTPAVYDNYEVGVPFMGKYKEIFNSDDLMYGGSGYGDNTHIKSIKKHAHGRPQSINLAIGPLSTMYFKLEKE